MAEIRAALSEHLGALQARDATRFATTLGDDVLVIDGNGAVMRGRDAILAAHAEWFASGDAWTFAYEIREIQEFASTAIAVIDVAYTQTADARPNRFVLGLVFVRDASGAWKFVFDQNTARASVVV